MRDDGGTSKGSLVQNLKRYGKLFGCLVLGVVVTPIIYWILVFVIVEPMRARSGRAPEAYIGLAYLVLAPIAVFLGSALTGFVSYPDVRTKLGFLGTAPGLYFVLVSLCSTFTYGNRDFAVSMLLPEAVWLAVSWTGNAMGYSFRARRKIRQAASDPGQ